MTAALVVPVAGDDKGRLANWAWLRRRYDELHPRLAVWPSVGRLRGPFCKAEFVNAAVDAVDADVVIIADADCFADSGALGRSIEVVEAGDVSWAVPFRDVYRLNAERTVELSASAPDAEPCPVDRACLDSWRPMYRGKPGGGIVVVARAAWDSVGGLDERFVGWGGEDQALGYALRGLFGTPHREREPLWHLWHEPQPGYDPTGKLGEASRTLLKRYRLAIEDAATMRALLDERGEAVGTMG